MLRLIWEGTKAGRHIGYLPFGEAHNLGKLARRRLLLHVSDEDSRAQQVGARRCRHLENDSSSIRQCTCFNEVTSDDSTR